jgi:hypothetical protein
LVSGLKLQPLPTERGPSLGITGASNPSFSTSKQGFSVVVLVDVVEVVLVVDDVELVDDVEVELVVDEVEVVDDVEVVDNVVEVVVDLHRVWG